jgi:uncharacterized protein YecE (DUF72 family)
MLPLFDPPEDNAARQSLAERLRVLAAQNIFLGASSWKYDGWLGDIYTRERYQTRGKFSQKKFEQECLSEYAEVFPIVCGDFSFYQFPTAEFWARHFATAPRQLRFAFKVPEEITVKHWPAHPRYGSRAGQPNQTFLNADLFTANFLELLAPYAARIATLIFEFTPFARAEGEAFLAHLANFLEALPEHFRYAVEIRNPEILSPAYLDLLTRTQTAHVLNSWTRMPDLATQAATPGIFPTDFSVVRALLKPGRSYENAVETFSPYQHVKHPYPEGRHALRRLIERAKIIQQPIYVFVNNRFEGNAPGTIRAVLDQKLES